MNIESQKPKIIAAVSTVLLAGTIMYLTMQMNANNQLEESLKTEKLKSESMLSEKLALKKEIAKFQEEIKALLGKNTDLDRVLAATAKKLDAKEQDIKKLERENAQYWNVKKQYKDLSLLKEELEKQLAQYTTSMSQLKSANDDLTKTVALLQLRNQDLQDELNSIRLVSFNDVRVESTKRNNKLTVAAKKTRKLAVKLDVPATANNLKFRITDPTGKELTAKDGNITANVTDISEPNYTASLNWVEGEAPAFKAVEMVYTPTKKMAPGIYRIDVTNDNVSIGSLQVRFR